MSIGRHVGRGMDTDDKSRAWLSCVMQHHMPTSWSWMLNGLMPGQRRELRQTGCRSALPRRKHLMLKKFGSEPQKTASHPSCLETRLGWSGAFASFPTPFLIHSSIPGAPSPHVPSLAVRIKTMPNTTALFPRPCACSCKGKMKRFSEGHTASSTQHFGVAEP